MILDRYVLRMWAGPFFGGLVMVLAVLLLSRALRLLDMATDFAGVWSFLFRLLALTLPYFLLIAAPIAFFLAMQHALVGLQERSEMDALRASGLSYARIVRGPMLAGVVLWIGLLVVAMHWLPAAQLEFGNLLRQVYAMKGGLGLSPRRFSMDLDGLTIYVDGRTEDGQYRGVMMDDRRADVPVLYLAKGGDFDARGEKLRLRLHDGVRLEGERGSQRMLAFDEYRVEIRMAAGRWQAWNVTDSASLMPAGLLWERARGGDHQAQVEFSRRLILPSVVLPLMLLALPLSLVRKRSGKSGAFVMGVAALLVVYNLQLSMHRLALDDRIPVAAMWGEHGMVLAFALWLWLRALRDQLPSWLTGVENVFSAGQRKVELWLSKRRNGQLPDSVG